MKKLKLMKLFCIDCQQLIGDGSLRLGNGRQPVEPSTKRVSVRLWIADDDDDPLWGYEIAACAEKPKRTHQPYEWRELFSDGNGGWFFEVQP